MRRLFPALALLLLSLLVFEKLAFSDMILARGDTYHYFYPYWDARNEAFRAGELPLWTPDIFMGAPLLADPQIGTFYPPNWLMIPFTAPDGIRYSILLHVFWASLGTFILFRRLISPAIVPALTAGLVFGLGGYIGAHVEQINQLQGLAWLPWLIYCLHRLLADERRFLLLLALAWAMQIFSGHTQTTFLSGIALGLYAISTQQFNNSTIQQNNSQSSEQFWAQYIAPLLKTVFPNLLKLGIAAIIAVLLAIPQLLPTLELTGMSNRGAGLTANEATAFSLPPWYLGRALLPSYDGLLFGEYIGYIGVIALVLASYGALSSWKNKRLWFWIGLALLGVFFAIGRANPIYVYLAELPGFNLFRVPARWLAFYALGMAMLTGYGVLSLQSQFSWKRLLLACLPLLILVPLAELAPIDATEITGSANPTMVTYLAWGVALAALFFSAFFAGREDKSKLKDSSISLVSILLAALVMAELFFASRVMPYNDLAPRDVYLGQRFTISQMLALNEGEIVPPRMLSISGRLFDVGDIGSLSARFDRIGMDTEAQATAFTAIKSQEILFPNLGLTWGIPSIDGYGGGLLPTIYYSQFTSLLLPAERTVDGRLGEMMAWPDCRGACIPDLSWLNRTGTRYLLIDKVYDFPVNEVFFDTSFHSYLDTESFLLYSSPDVNFDTVHVLYEGDGRPVIGVVEADVEARNAEPQIQSISDTQSLAIYSWPEVFLHPNTISVFVPEPETSLNILAVTAVDSRTGAFFQLNPEGISRILSSDIKIYELEDIRRAYLASEVEILPDNWQGHEDAVLSLRSNPDLTIIHGDGEVLTGSGEVTFINYSATRIEMSVNSDAEAYLVLNDAYYPDWRATINGEENPVYRANVMFRAVTVPAGESTVVFEFVPNLWYWSMAFGAVVWMIVLGILAWFWRNGHASDVPLQNS